MKYDIRSILQLSLLLGSVAIIGICLVYVVSEVGVVSPKTRVFHHTSSEHAGPFIGWDWKHRLMPMDTSNGDSVYFYQVHRDRCLQEEEQCGPTMWQMDSICEKMFGAQGQPLPFDYGTALSTASLEASKPMLETQILEKDGSEGVMFANSEITHGHLDAARAACMHARMPSLNTARIDPTTWSLLSNHDHLVLILFSFFIILLLAVVEVAKNENIGTVWSESHKSMVYWAISIIAAAIVVMRLATAYIHTEDNVPYKSPGATGSFLYGTLHFLLYAVYSTFTLSYHMEGGSSAKNSQDSMLPGETDQLNPEFFENTPNPTAGNENEFGPGFGYAGSKPPKPTELRLDSFTTRPMPHTQALYNVVASISNQTLSSAKIDAEGGVGAVIARNQWLALQIVLVPLWLLVILCSFNGAVSDVQVQTHFLLGLLFALLDLYSVTAYEIFRLVYRAMGEKAPPNVARYVVWFTSALQVVIVLFLNFQIGGRYDNVDAENEQTFLAFMSTAGIAIFDVYVGLSILLKVYMTEDGRYRGVFRDSSEVICFLLIVCVFVYYAIVLGYRWNGANMLLSPNTPDSKLTPALIDLRLEYMGDWTKVRAI